jgi:hypothetical protein
MPFRAPEPTQEATRAASVRGASTRPALQ